MRIQMQQLEIRFSKLSLNLADNPGSIACWEELLNLLLKAKLSKDSEYFVYIRSTYDAFLAKFPLLESYWVDYAVFEHTVGNTSKALQIFKRSLSHCPGSLLCWMEYLKFLLENSDQRTIMTAFQQAEQTIGLHFYSGEFWDLYLETVEKYFGRQRYLVLLRKVLEIPQYHFARFYARWFKIIDKGKDDIGAGKSKSKKVFTELYITVQFQTMEMYQFEVDLNTQYYTTNFVSQNEINTWERYLDYLIDSCYSNKIIVEAFERAVTATAAYDTIWLKYSLWCEKKVNSKNILQRAMSVVVNKHEIVQLLTYTLMGLEQFHLALDLLQNLSSDGDIQYFIQYIELQMFLNRDVSEQIKEKLKDPEVGGLLKELLPEWHKVDGVNLLHS